jgi:hypothetical protein
MVWGRMRGEGAVEGRRLGRYDGEGVNKLGETEGSRDDLSLVLNDSEG